ncbi:MAG: hypothetical protein ACREQA_04800 [Candidatus Binatia bacterium]
MDGIEMIETTLGDLIAALTEEARPFVCDEKEAYKVVAFALTHLLYDSGANPKKWQLWH